MKQDNKWHPVIVLKKDDHFAVLENEEQAVLHCKIHNLHAVEGYRGRWNWNKGQPLIDLDDFMVTIVDTSKSELAPETVLSGTFKVLSDEDMERFRKTYE